MDPRPYRSMRVEGERTTLSCFEVASAADAPALAVRHACAENRHAPAFAHHWNPMQMIAFFMPSLGDSDYESQDSDMRRRVPRIADLLLRMDQQR